MSPLFRDNPGDRPSRLTLGRLHTGELGEDERAEVERWLREHPEETWLDDLDAARSKVRPFDPASLRQRAAASLTASQASPTAANNWRWFAPLLAVAVALMVFLSLPSENPQDPHQGTRYRGGATLQIFELSGDVLVPYEGAALGAGDTIGFRVVPGDHDHLVLLSVEVDGTINVFYPESGFGSEPVAPGGHPVELPDSIVLDGAPDPEVFVAVFGAEVDEAHDRVRGAWDEGGLDAILDWAERELDADAVTVVRQ